MRNFLIITGGAGFVGSNLIKHLIVKTKYKLISIDNYSTGLKKNHIVNKRVRYIKGDTNKIYEILKPYKKKYILFFILVNMLEYIKAFMIQKNVLILISQELQKFLVFV